MFERYPKNPDERLSVVNKDTIRDDLSATDKNRQKPDDHRPKGEILEKHHRDEEDEDDDEQ